MEEQLRAAVRQRAGARCEYCHLAEVHSILPFELEHIIAEKHGGESIADNLAWACRYCNVYKGSNIAGVDPITQQIVPLYHPRRERWDEHFRWRGPLYWLEFRPKAGRPSRCSALTIQNCWHSGNPSSPKA
jgi:HNH endonuclease